MLGFRLAGTMLVRLAAFASLGVVAGLALPPFVDIVPRLVIGVLLALLAWLVCKGVAGMD